jgi:outer membrane protein
MSTHTWCVALFGILLSFNAFADEVFQYRLQGDVGGFITAAQSPIRADTMRPLLLPYAYIDYGRAFVRIDTFGIKTLPLGYGHLELVGRIKFDGFQTDNNPLLKGIGSRQNSVPVGLGSFQLTPIGGFFLYAFRDENRSKGDMYEATYATEFNLGKLTLYPQIEIEHFSRDYTQYFYGVSAFEAAGSGYSAYKPMAATNTALSVVLEFPLSEGWITQFYLQRKRLDSTISDSPLVDTKYLSNAYVNVAFRYE